MSVSNHLMKDTSQYGFQPAYFPDLPPVSRGFEHAKTGTGNLLKNGTTGNFIRRNRDSFTITFDKDFGPITLASPDNRMVSPKTVNYAAGFNSTFTWYLAPFEYKYWYSTPATGVFLLLFRGGNAGNKWYVQLGSRNGYAGSGTYTAAACWVRNDPSPIGAYTNDGHDTHTNYKSNTDFDLNKFSGLCLAGSYAQMTSLVVS